MITTEQIEAYAVQIDKLKPKADLAFLQEIGTIIGHLSGDDAIAVMDRVCQMKAGRVGEAEGIAAIVGNKEKPWLP